MYNFVQHYDLSNFHPLVFQFSQVPLFLEFRYTLVRRVQRVDKVINLRQYILWFAEANWMSLRKIAFHWLTLKWFYAAGIVWT